MPGPKPKLNARRSACTTRITEQTRARLEAAAERSGRSFAQEIELRLELSFWLDAFRDLKERL